MSSAKLTRDLLARAKTVGLSVIALGEKRHYYVAHDFCDDNGAPVSIENQTDPLDALVAFLRQGTMARSFFVACTSAKTLAENLEAEVTARED